MQLFKWFVDHYWWGLFITFLIWNLSICEHSLVTFLYFINFRNLVASNHFQVLQNPRFCSHALVEGYNIPYETGFWDSRSWGNVPSPLLEHGRSSPSSPDDTVHYIYRQGSASRQNSAAEEVYSTQSWHYSQSLYTKDSSFRLNVKAIDSLRREGSSG